MVNDMLTLLGGGDGLRAFLARVVGLEPTATVRLRQLGADAIDVFATTPFEVVAARRARGRVSRDGAVVSAQTLYAGLVDSDSRGGEIDLGPAQDFAWPGALPPAEGFVLLDTLPVTVASDLSDQGRQLARQFSGPLGPPTSLLNQPVIEVEGAGQTVEIPMRMVFACTNLGLIPGFSAPQDVPRHLRVAGLGRWVRLDAPFGSVYHSTRLSLF